jgi:two-component system response regulator AlgR
VKVLIVDDEAPARDRLRQIVEEIDGFEFAGEAGNGEQAIAAAAEARPDIVLLDIRMPGIDGIETAHHLNALDNPPAVVFTTAYDEYAIAAFDARAIGYVLKPVRRSRLEGALEHARKLTGRALDEIASESGMSPGRQHICAQAHGRLMMIPVADIRYFRADQKYVLVCHAEGHTLIDESLKSLEQEFGDRFVRIHRGALVAVAAIETLDRTGEGRVCVKLRGDSHDGDEELIISRRHVAEVRRRLKGG